MAGTLPFSTAEGELTQSVCTVPALAGVGKRSRTMFTRSEEAGHTPLETVHKKLFVPVPIPESADTAELNVVITAVPTVKDQDPVPTEGAVPVNADVPEQISWSAPA